MTVVRGLSHAVPILVVSNHGDVVGGGELSLLGLLGGLDRRRWAPTLVVPMDGTVAEGARNLGFPVEVIALPTLRRPGAAVVRSVLALRQLTASVGAALLHANGSRAMAYAGSAGRLARRPVIWHVRIADRDPFLDRPLGALATLVIVISRAVKRRFSTTLAPKIRLVYNGVDLERFRPRPPDAALRQTLGVPDAVPVVGAVGRFVTFKGFSDLVDAAARLQRAMPEVHWVVVGDGPLRADLEARSESLGLKAHVHFAGWRDDVPDILALCDVFLLPSVSEHFGRVLIEAMAMARPIVATEAGGVPEIVVSGQTGLLVPPEDPQAMALTVETLLRDRSRAGQLGIAARRRAESTFSLAAHVAAVERVYREATEDSRAC